MFLLIPANDVTSEEHTCQGACNRPAVRTDCFCIPRTGGTDQNPNIYVPLALPVFFSVCENVLFRDPVSGSSGEIPCQPFYRRIFDFEIRKSTGNASGTLNDG